MDRCHLALALHRRRDGGAGAGARRAAGLRLARGRVRRPLLVDRLALAPIIVPTIILSVALYGLFAKLKLIGEWYGLVVAHTVLALPFVVLVMVAGLRDFDRGAGAGRRGAGRQPPANAAARVTLPLLRPSLVSAGLLAFIIVVRRARGGAVPGRAEHDPAQEDVRQHHDGDRSHDRRRVGDADPAGLDRAGPDRPLRARAAAAARAEGERHG